MFTTVRSILSRNNNFNFTLGQTRKLTSNTSKLPLYRFTKLSNGIRVQTQSFPAPTASVAVVVNTGSAHENKTNNGVAHFLEHLAFKV